MMVLIMLTYFYFQNPGKIAEKVSAYSFKWDMSIPAALAFLLHVRKLNKYFFYTCYILV